jgi:hypothetical protein
MSEIAHRHGAQGWHTHEADEYQNHQRPIDDEKGPYPVLGGHPAQLSDGFHTMEELYEHRRALTAVLAAAGAADKETWRSKAHHPDDDPMFEGYFIVGIELPTGTITYHYQLKHWDDFAAVPELEHARKWDKATPQDMVTRLFGLAAIIASGAEAVCEHTPAAPHA